MIQTSEPDVPDMYETRNRRAVDCWLEEYPFLKPLLVEARNRIPGFFGNGIRVELKLVEFAENAGGAELFVTIRAPGPWREARKQFDAFVEAWWDKHLPEARCKLSFELGFFD